MLENELVPGAVVPVDPGFDDRRGAVYSADELPGFVLPEDDGHAGRVIFPVATDFEGRPWDGGEHNTAIEALRRPPRSFARLKPKPKNWHSQERKLGARVAPPVYLKIVQTFLIDSGIFPSIEEAVSEGTKRGKPTPRGQHAKEFLALVVQMLRSVGLAPAAIQQVLPLTPSQITRLSTHDLANLKLAAESVDWGTAVIRSDSSAYTAPLRLDHPARRTKFGANNSREDSLSPALEMLTTLTQEVATLKQQTAVIAANQVDAADRLDVLEALMPQESPSSHPDEG